MPAGSFSSPADGIVDFQFVDAASIFSGMTMLALTDLVQEMFCAAILHARG